MRKVRPRPHPLSLCPSPSPSLSPRLTPPPPFFLFVPVGWVGAVRTKGAAFYQFSSDTSKRAEQQAELLAARQETEAARADPTTASTSTSTTTSTSGPTRLEGGKAKEPFKFGGKASEKRKREVEERKALIEAKRKKKEGEEFFRSLEAELPLPTPPSLPSAPHPDPEQRS